MSTEHTLTRKDVHHDWDRSRAPVLRYVLCSLAGDLKILEIVDAGVWNVGMVLPVSVFE